MDKNSYQELVNKHMPKEKLLKNGIISFAIGGLMGVLGQLLIEIYSYYLNISTKDASTFMLITLIFIGCLFAALGFFDRWVKFARCGLIVPITGFAHSMMSTSLEYRREGLIAGLGSNMFKLAGSVIMFGVVSAYVFGILRFFVIGG